MTSDNNNNKNFQKGVPTCSSFTGAFFAIDSMSHQSLVVCYNATILIEYDANKAKKTK